MEWNWKDLNLNMQVIGEGIPVLLLHGYSLDHQMMLACMEPVFSCAGFLSSTQRFYIDLPGMGKTNHPEWITNADVLLDILAEFVKEQFGEQQFMVVGESYGGYLARGLMYRFPQQILSALLLCPVVFPKREDRHPAAFSVGASCAFDSKTQSEPAFPAFSKEIVMQTQQTFSRYRQEIYAASQLADLPYLIDFQKNGYVFSFPVDTPKEPYAFPVLLFTGKQDSFVGYSDAWELQKQFPKATFVSLDCAGHYLQIDQEEQFTQLSAAWLRRCLKIE